MTGLATAIYENQAVAPMADETAAYLGHVHHQLAGIETHSRQYPFTLETSVRAYR
jgi:gallate dioxygenase